MSLCDIFPDDPSCKDPTPDPVPDPEKPDDNVGGDDDKGEQVVDGDDEAGEEGEQGEEGEGDAEASEKKGDHWYYQESPLVSFVYAAQMKDLIALNKPMLSQGAFLLVAMWNVIYAGAYAFRYRSKSSFYDIGKLGANETNYLKLSDQIRLYGALAIFVPVSITQLLTLFGMATSLNMMAWGLLAGLGGMIWALTVNILRNIGYDAAWTKAQSTTSTSAVKTAAVSTLSVFDDDSFDDIAMEAAMGVLLAFHFDTWYWANFEGLTIDQQDEMLTEWKETIEANKEEWAVEVSAKAEEGAEEGAEEDAEEGADEDAEEGAEDEEGADEGEEGEEGDDADEQ